MVIEILTSVVDNDNYKLNAVYLLKKLKKKVITKQGKNHLHTKKFDYNKARIYDFTRTARTDIRDDAVESPTHSSKYLNTGSLIRSICFISERFYNQMYSQDLLYF